VFVRYIKRGIPNNHEFACRVQFTFFSKSKMYTLILESSSEDKLSLLKFYEGALNGNRKDLLNVETYVLSKHYSNSRDIEVVNSFSSVAEFSSQRYINESSRVFIYQRLISLLVSSSEGRVLFHSLMKVNERLDKTRNSRKQVYSVNFGKDLIGRVHDKSLMHEAVICMCYLNTLLNTTSLFCFGLAVFECPIMENSPSLKYCFLMERIEGIPLYKILSSLSDEEVEDVILQIVGGLQLAHERFEFKHNDLHLGNIIVTKGNYLAYVGNKKNRNVSIRAKIIDFDYAEIEGLKRDFAIPYTKAFPVLSDVYKLIYGCLDIVKDNSVVKKAAEFFLVQDNNIDIMSQENNDTNPEDLSDSILVNDGLFRYTNKNDNRTFSDFLMFMEKGVNSKYTPITESTQQLKIEIPSASLVLEVDPILCLFRSRFGLTVKISQLKVMVSFKKDYEATFALVKNDPFNTRSLSRLKALIDAHDIVYALLVTAKNKNLLETQTQNARLLYAETSNKINEEMQFRILSLKRWEILKNMIRTEQELSVSDFSSLGAQSVLKKCLCFLSKGNYLTVLKILVESTKDQMHIPGCLNVAVKKGHLDIVAYLSNFCKFNFKHLRLSLENDHIEIFKYILSKYSATNTELVRVLRKNSSKEELNESALYIINILSNEKVLTEEVKTLISWAEKKEYTHIIEALSKLSL